MTDARFYFEHDVESAVREHRAAELVLAFGEPRKGEGGRSSLPGDPTARAAESAARARATLASTEETIGEALARIEGLRQVVGDHAIVLEMRHVDLMPWADIASQLGITTRTARRWRDVACDWADTFGWAHAVQGVGSAQG